MAGLERKPLVKPTIIVVGCFIVILLIDVVVGVFVTLLGSRNRPPRRLRIS